MRSKHVVVFLLLLIVAGGFYFLGLHLPYYADDFQYVYVDPQSAALHDFVAPNQANPFYRPLQTLLLALIQVAWGWDTTPIRILHLLLHACVAVLIFRALRSWNIALPVAFFGAVYFLGAQMNAAAVLGNDTVSQLLSTMFSVATLWLLYRYKSTSVGTWTYILSICMFFLALVSKETAVGLLAAVVFVSYVLSPKPRQFGRILLEVIPYLICCIVYIALRSEAGAENPRIDSEQYGFGLGMNVVVNVGLLLVQSIIPVSSLSVAEIVNDDRHVALVGIALFALVIAAIVLYGLWKSPHRTLIVGLCMLMLFSWVPVIFLSHISEQYAYNSAPFVVALVAIALQFYLSERRSMLKIAGPALGVALIVNIVGIFDKASAMKEQGQRAEILFDQVIAYGKDAPPNGSVCLVHPNEDRFYFSVYRVRGFSVLSWSEHLFQHRANRPDVRLYVIDSADYRIFHTGTPHLAFTYDPVTLRVHPL